MYLRWMPATLLLAAAIVLPAVARADDAAPSRMSEVKTQRKQRSTYDV
jgi:hypothetical protein